MEAASGNHPSVSSDANLAKLMMLDEPLTGLDAAASRLVKDMIRQGDVMIENFAGAFLAFTDVVNPEAGAQIRVQLLRRALAAQKVLWTP